MPKVNSDYSAITNDPNITIYHSEPFIDIKVILMALREDLPKRTLYLGRNENKKRTNVIIPTLNQWIILYYVNGHINIRGRLKKYRFPCELESFMIPEWAIDVIARVIVHNNWHTKRFKF